MKEKIREIYKNSKRIVPALMLATSLLLVSCGDIKPTGTSITPLPPQTPTKPLLVPEIKQTLTPKPELKKNIVNFNFTQGFENAIRQYGPQGELLIKIIIASGNRYVEKYGCTVNSIIIDVTDVSTLKVLPDGTRQFDGDSSSRGIIKLPIKDFITFFTNRRDNTISWANLGKELQDTIIHSTGHACKGLEILLSNKIEIGNGEKVYGYQGLSALIELKDGTKTRFNKVEEGMVEAFAINLEPQYGAKDPSYMRLRSLSQMIIQKWVSIDEVNAYLKTSNFTGFLQKLYGKPNITNVDIANTLDIYSDLFRGEITAAQAMLELESLHLITR